MSKKVTVLLVFLLIIIGALGGYGFNLNKEIGNLNTEIGNLDTEIATLTELQEDTNRQIRSLQASINILDMKLNIKMASFMAETASQITGMEDKFGTLSTKIEDIPPTIDAEGLYQKVRGGVVEVVTETKGGKEVTGSGFAFDGEGYIVTAYHVVKEANKVDVILHDGTISSASITGYDPYSDIAVLRLAQAVATEALTLGDSNAIAIGEPVIAIGTPFELSGTITSGIVSQKDRFVDIEYDGDAHRRIANLIQCDAPVNFGNSGGPLINAKGEVIGLVIARIDPQEGDGIYYAVSSNKLKRVALSIIDHGFFDYPWLGVGLADLSPEEARARQLDTVNGVRVTATLPGPAAPAGIKVDDIIVAIDGIPVHEAADLASYLGENKSPQELATLTIIRDGGRLELSVQLTKRTS